MSDYITTAEAAHYEGITERAIRKRLSSGKYVSRTETEGSIVRHLIAIESLSDSAKKRYFQEQLHIQATKKNKTLLPADTTNVDVLGKVQRKFGERGSKLIENVVERERIAKEVLAIRSSRVKGKTEAIKQLAASVGQNPATIRRWADRYVELGIDGLLHTKVIESLFTQKTYRSFDSLAVDYLKVQYLSDRRNTVELAYEKTVEMASMKGWRIGSYNTAWRIIQDIPEEDIIYFREGEEAWRAKCMPRALRDDPKYINEIWEGDHTRMNFFVEAGGKAVRPWLTFWLDAKSRAVVGWCISLQANTETIGLSLRYAILPKNNSPIQGIPEYVLIDNGQDYRSKKMKGHQVDKFGEQLNAPHLQGVFSRIGIKARHCRIRDGAAKGRVERSFGYVTERFYRDYIGWCGASPKERPDGFDEKKLCAEGKLLSMEQCIEDFAEFVQQYNETAKDVLGGLSPIEVYAANQRWKEDIPSARLLDLWLLSAEARTVHNIGIQFNNRVYENVPALSGYVREQVSILYDPNDITKIYAFALNGDFIAELPLKERRSYITSDEETFKHVAMQKSRRKDVRERKSEMLDRLKEDGVARPRKLMGTGTNEGDPKVVTIHKDERAAKAIEQSRKAGDETAEKEMGIHEQYVKEKSDKIAKRLKLDA